MIPDNYKPIRQVGNGKTTSFSFDFPMLSENFIKVYREKDGIQELVDPSEYVWGYLPVEGDEPAEDLPPENVITFYEAPEEGTVIVIAREIPLEQTTPYKTSSGFPAVRVEDNFDKLTAITQQLMEEVDRCVKVEITGDQTPEALLSEVYGKLDSATEVAQEAVEAAKGATEAVASAENTLAEVNTYVDESKTEINALITKTTTEIDQTIAEATEEIKAAAVAEAEKAIEAGAQAINKTASEAASQIEELAQEATQGLEGNVEHARIWAEGEQAEVQALGGELSSRGWANQASNSANSASQAAEQANNNATAAANSAESAKADADAAKMAADNAWGKVNNVGDIFYTSRLDKELNGAVDCDGETYNTGDFSGKQSVGNLLSNGSLPYVSLEEYANLVTTNGSCRAFGWDGGAEFRVPLLNDVYIEAGNAETAGEFINESLPEIAGEFAGTGLRGMGVANGAFHDIYGYGGGIGSGSAGNGCGVKFNASYSNPVYQEGAKVKPDSVRYRAMVQLANTMTDEALITATNTLHEARSLANEAITRLDGFDTTVDNAETEINTALEDALERIEHAGEVAVNGTTVTYWE